MENNAKIGNINFVENNGNLLVSANKSIYDESFYFQDFYDDRRIESFIKHTEKTIRSSEEYNTYLALLKSNYSIFNYDNIQSNISSTDVGGGKFKKGEGMNVHHYPLSLHDVVETVMMHHVVHKDSFTSFSLAKEIMELHYKQEIGLVPLIKTNHELAHDGAIFISENQIFGKWKDFAKEYADGLSEELKSKLERLSELSNAHAATDFRGIYD